MEFERLWLLNSNDRGGALHVRLRTPVSDPFALLKGRVPLGGPTVFERVSGKNLRDLLGTSMAVLYLISDRVVELLRSNEVSGWTTYPIEVIGKDGIRIDGYHGLSITGKCGRLDNSRSPKVWRDPPSPNGQRYQAWMGLYFDPKTWDGSDIFCPEPTGHIFVVERVRGLLEQAKVTGMDFTRATDVERLMLI